MVHITKGELTQEEKELLEVIGKGMGAGLRPGARCLPGLGAWRSPGGTPGGTDRPRRFCEVSGLAPGNSIPLGGLGPVAGAERSGAESSAGTRAEVAEVRLPNQPLERHISRPQLVL